MNIVWKVIPEAPSYEVSDAAQIRRIGVDRCGRAPKVLKQSINSTGRLQVSLCVGSRIYSQAVHRIVASAFIGAAPLDKPLVCHRDGDPLNNLPNNLYYGNHSENAFDSSRHGTMARGIKNGNSRLSGSQVSEIIASAETATALARKMGVNISTVCRIRKGESWRHAQATLLNVEKVTTDTPPLQPHDV